jgi:hypothetical protein
VALSLWKCWCDQLVPRESTADVSAGAAAGAVYMSLTSIVKLRDAVDGLCAAIDAGEIRPSEQEMLALAVVVEKEAGPLKHDLLVKLASRCKNGRAVLTRQAN